MSNVVFCEIKKNIYFWLYILCKVVILSWYYIMCIKLKWSSRKTWLKIMTLVIPFPFPPKKRGNKKGWMNSKIVILSQTFLLDNLKLLTKVCEREVVWKIRFELGKYILEFINIPATHFLDGVRSKYSLKSFSCWMLTT